MDIFLLLFTNLIPLYILIGVGYAAGRFFEIQRETLANLAIFIILPVVMFGFVVELDFQPSYIFLPLIVFLIMAAVALLALHVGRRVFGDSRANLMAMCAGIANMGYFGLPLVILLFDKQWIGVYAFMLLGNVIFEATIGYYIAARGNFSMRESLIKLMKFPSIYAIVLGLLVNFLHIDLPKQFFTYRDYFKGAYVIVGMMIIGTALSKVQRLEIGKAFIALSFLGKFIVWPLVAYGVVVLDRAVLHLWSEEVHGLLIMLSLTPPAANITAFAAQLNLRPEKAATTVLLGTFFALFYIPVMLTLLKLY